MPSRLALMHAVPNASRQLVRGRLDTITVWALGWKRFPSARDDERSGQENNRLGRSREAYQTAVASESCQARMLEELVKIFLPCFQPKQTGVD